jgi:hypothetical protein
MGKKSGKKKGRNNQKLSRRFIVMFSDKSTNEADNQI